MGGREDARIPRALFWGLIFFAAVGVLGLAFAGGLLAGKWFGAPREANGLTVGGSASSAAPAPVSAPAVGASSTVANAVATPAPSPSLSPSQGGVGDASAAQVAAYFAEMDRILGGAKQSGDPNTVARQILEQALAGNTRGFDELLAKQRAVAAGVRQVQPPPPCAEHQRRSLALVEKGISLLTTARDAIAAENPTALTSLLTSGQEVESEARAVDALATEIRKRYGL